MGGAGDKWAALAAGLPLRGPLRPPRPHPALLLLRRARDRHRLSVVCAREHERAALLGPLTEGQDVPRDSDLDLGDRARALDRLRCTLPERDAGLSVGPGLRFVPAARMQNIRERNRTQHRPVPEPPDGRRSLEAGHRHGVEGRLVDATFHALPHR
ncbi:hypothetical protein [Streptomyces virginiae]|uniref:hypothetical protein n=1 Tax=Streptomyces virginiae TaxID=1961 RepID=UPI0036A34757